MNSTNNINTLALLLTNNTTSNATVFLPKTTVEIIFGALILFTISIVTSVGNVLVIWSIFTYRPLKKVQNFFLVSLACADLCVATLVMPFHIAKLIMSRWVFGLVMCQLWITSDILLCTSSILNLCAIALDRYWAITDPINYANRRTKKLVLQMIAAIWVLSFMISVPPLLGWNDWSQKRLLTSCEYTTDAGFVIYSACGSFYIPLIIMTTVYVKIFIAARQRLMRHTPTIRRGLQLVQKTFQDPIDKIGREDVGETQTMLSDGDKSQREDQKSVKIALSKEEAACQRVSLVTVHCDSAGDYQTALLSDANDGSVETPTNIDHPAINGTDKGKSVIRFADTNISINKDGIENSLPPQFHHTVVKADSRSSFFGNLRMASTTAISNFKCENVFHRSTSSSSSSGKSIFSKFRRRRSSKTGVSFSPQCQGLIDADPGGEDGQASESMRSFFKEKEKISIAKEKKAAKTLAIIMGVFVMCWLPFFLLYVIAPFVPEDFINPVVFELTNWLGYINSSLNPVIYTIFNTDFRAAFSRLLYCRKGKFRR